MKVILSVLTCLFAAMGAYADDTESLWMIEQDFVRFGKKDAYEKLKKEKLKAFARYSKDKGQFSCYGMQESDSPQYIYLTELENYSGLQTFMRKMASFYDTKCEEGWTAHTDTCLSTINFKVKSLNSYLPQCSSIPQGKESFFSLPGVHYFVFSITPGYGKIVEDHLSSVAEEQLSKPDPICFRSWRVVFGADTPKYIVAIFAPTIRDAERQVEKIDFIPMTMKNILRNQKQGSGLMRADLSNVNKT
jgi:hypothetical protein